MKIVTIDRTACSVLRASVLPALNEALARFGLSASIVGKVSYAPGVQMSASLEFIAVAAGESAEAARLKSRAADFARDAPPLGLPADCYGKHVTISGDEYRIDGFSSRRGTKIALTQVRTGAQKLCPLDTLKRVLAKSPAVAPS